MKRAIWDKRGFTTAELLVGAVFGLIVIATLYGFYRDQLFYLLSQETKTATLEDTRGALDIMVRELRNAGSWGTGAAPPTCARVVEATASKIHIQADLDGQLVGGVPNCNSATGEDVTYELLAAGTSTCPGPRIARNGDCLVSNVATPTGSLFTYFDRDGAQLAAAPPVDDIKRVKITFEVQAVNPDPRTKSATPNISSTLSSSVEFRN